MSKHAPRLIAPPLVRLIAAVGLLLALILLAACGGESPGGGAPTLTGQALAGEEPAADALVLALDMSGRPAGEARTDAQGRFSLSLPPGTYTVTAEAGPGTLGLPAPEIVTVNDAGTPVTVTLRYAMAPAPLPDDLLGD